MPNYCYNEITIEGDTTELKKLLRYVKSRESEFDFNKILPYPEEYSKMDAGGNNEGYQHGGYEWCIANWGTKWKAEEIDVSLDDNCLTVHFDSAWSPALGITAKLAELYPNLRFKHSYEEEGLDFSGYVAFENGVQVDAASGSYKEYSILESDDKDDWDEDENDEDE